VSIFVHYICHKQSKKQKVAYEITFLCPNLPMPYNRNMEPKGKQVTAVLNTSARTEELLDVVFSMHSTL
jgi:hypothetical protein